MKEEELNVLLLAIGVYLFALGTLDIIAEIMSSLVLNNFFIIEVALVPAYFSVSCVCFYLIKSKLSLFRSKAEKVEK